MHLKVKRKTVSKTVFSQHFRYLMLRSVATLKHLFQEQSL